jgi:predicted transcriptional regulator
MKMKKTMLMAIAPQYAELIFNGEKTIEYRRTWPREDVDKVLFYVTRPVKMVVGEADCGVMLRGYIDWLWRQTETRGGLSYEEYMTYFAGRAYAVGIELLNVKRYVTPKELSEFGVSKAPQSFVYL